MIKNKQTLTTLLTPDFWWYSSSGCQI